MVVIKNSMQNDLQAAQEGVNGSKDGENEFNNPVSGIVSGGESNASVQQPVPTPEETGIIKDDYVGNISYEALKNQKEETLEGQGQNLEKKREEVAEILSNFEKTDKEDLFEKDLNSETFEDNLSDAKEKMVSKLGKKKIIVVAVAALLLVSATVIFLQNKNTASKQTTGTPAVKNQTAEQAAEKTPNVENTNDALRIQNIDTIAQATALFYLNEKVDLPVSANYIKLNEANPVSDFIREALQRDGKSADLVLDPRDPGFYYTYRSVDGQSIEFGARMEDLKSIDCGDQSPCIYKKILTQDDIQKMGEALEQNEK